MRELHPFRIASLLVGLVLAAGCNSSSGTAQDFEVVGLEVGTDAPQLGHEMCVQVEFKAAEAAPDATLVFLVATRADVDAGAAEPALGVVDTKTLMPVIAGNNLYELQLDLPEDTIAPGEYYLIAVVDPLDVVGETDEGNNGVSADRIAQIGVLITIGDQAEALPDIVLESIVVDDPVVETDVAPESFAAVDGTADVPNSDFGITATVRSSGPGALPDVKLKAEMEVPGLGVFPLELWDTDSGTYADRVAIASLVATEPTAIDLDVLIPQPTRDALASLLPPALQQGAGEGGLPVDCLVRVTVDPDDDYAEYEGGIILPGDEDGDDNSETARVVLLLEEEDQVQGQIAGAAQPVNELNWDVPFVKSFSNGNVGVGVRFGATANVGTKGILAEAGASVPMTLVGFTIDLLGLDAKGLFNPLRKTDNGFVVTLKALGLKVYEKRTKEDEDLAQSPLSFSKEQSYSANFVVGPVPMFVKIGARGTVGLDVGASVGSNFQVAAEPYLNFTVFGQGGIGGSILGWTLAGGLGTDMKLIDERFHAGITAGLSFDSATSVLTGSITEEVSNDLKGPSGRVYLFVTATGKILWATVSARWEYTLTKWSSFVKKDTLFNKTQSLSVTIP